jgi:hypothetical protein
MVVPRIVERTDYLVFATNAGAQHECWATYVPSMGRSAATNGYRSTRAWWQSRASRSIANDVLAALPFTDPCAKSSSDATFYGRFAAAHFDEFSDNNGSVADPDRRKSNGWFWPPASTGQ